MERTGTQRTKLQCHTSMMGSLRLFVTKVVEDNSSGFDIKYYGQ